MSNIFNRLFGRGKSKSLAPQVESLKDQILNRCVHFTGVFGFLDEKCRAGIEYSDFNIDKLPCLKRGGACVNVKFPTNRDAEKSAKEALQKSFETLALQDIFEDYEKTKLGAGNIPCRCGGRLIYFIALKSKIFAHCKKCGIKIK